MESQGVKKGRGGYVLGWALILILAIVFALIVAITTRDSTLPDPKLPNLPTPTLPQLDQAINLAQQYLDGLYKPLDEDEAVQSEHYGLPLRAYFYSSGEWALLGEDETSTITPGPSDRLSEQYTISLQKGELVATVRLVWQGENGEFYVTAKPHTVRAPVELWIGQTRLGTFQLGASGRIASSVLKASDFSTLATLRYTVRHATQQAYLYWQIRGDKEKAARLKRFLSSHDYRPGFDMRAIIFNRSAELPDNLAFNRSAYQDCEHLPKPGPLAYPYKSKVCQVLGIYFATAERDPFLQATFALHMLQKYKAPKRDYDVSTIEEQWMQGDNPLDTAQHLRKQWGRTKVGIPSCRPDECQDVASGIRTFVYGALEAELGYRHGDVVARQFADAAAMNTLLSQIVDGNIRMQTGDVYRGVHTGSFLAYWDKEGRFAPPDPSIVGAIALTLIDEAAMPPEYLGISPTNSETTFDAWAFLMRYRCLKYDAGCP